MMLSCSREDYMSPKKRAELPPLQRFDYKLVEAPFEGLLVNTDRLLEKKLRWAIAQEQGEEFRRLSLLLVMLRFAKNSYAGVRYISADTPVDPKRKETYVLFIPPITRQLLDLLFSLVYMLEDFGPRSLLYMQSGWREVVEEWNQVSNAFSKEREWKDYLSISKVRNARLADMLGLDEQTRSTPSKIKYWPTPTQLTGEPGSSLGLRKHLERWIYRDVSSLSHLGFGGLQKVSAFLVADLLQAGPEVQERATQSFRFQQVSRAATITLAIATEIDNCCQLGNARDADYLWAMFSAHVAEARELYELHYRALVQ